MRILLICVGLLSLSACSTTGPFVTNISRTKGDNLLIEKCVVEHNFLLSTTTLKECSASTI